MFEPETRVLSRYFPLQSPSFLPMLSSDQTDYHTEEGGKKAVEEDEATQDTQAQKESMTTLHCPVCKINFSETAQAVDHVCTEHANSDCCPYCGQHATKTADVLSWRCHLINHLLPPLATKSDLTTPPTATACQNNMLKIDPLLPLALDEAIQMSLSRVPDSATQDRQARAARLASSVLLCGGCSSIPRLLPFLQSRLPTLPAYTFVMNTKDLDARFVGWKGGSVAARLDEANSGEQWIARTEWEDAGERIFKERLSFPI